MIANKLASITAKPAAAASNTHGRSVAGIRACAAHIALVLAVRDATAGAGPARIACATEGRSVTLAVATAVERLAQLDKREGAIDDVVR
jgi:hypothetical protein